MSFTAVHNSLSLFHHGCQEPHKNLLPLHRFYRLFFFLCAECVSFCYFFFFILHGPGVQCSKWSNFLMLFFILWPSIEALGCNLLTYNSGKLSRNGKSTDLLLVLLHRPAPGLVHWLFMKEHAGVLLQTQFVPCQATPWQRPILPVSLGTWSWIPSLNFLFFCRSMLRSQPPGRFTCLFLPAVRCLPWLSRSWGIDMHLNLVCAQTSSGSKVSRSGLVCDLNKGYIMHKTEAQTSVCQDVADKNSVYSKKIYQK